MDRESIALIIKQQVEALSDIEIRDLDSDMFIKGVMDSLNMINLIVFLEQRFNVKLNRLFEDRGDLGSINKIAEYIENLTGEQNENT